MRKIPDVSSCFYSHLHTCACTHPTNGNTHTTGTPHTQSESERQRRERVHTGVWWKVCAVQVRGAEFKFLKLT